MRFFGACPPLVGWSVLLVQWMTAAKVMVNNTQCRPTRKWYGTGKSVAGCVVVFLFDGSDDVTDCPQQSQQYGVYCGFLSGDAVGRAKTSRFDVDDG